MTPRHCTLWNYFHVAAAILIATASPAFAAEKRTNSLETRFQKEFRPILAELCFNCHGPEKQKGDVRLDTLAADVSKLSDPGIWHDALDQLSLGEMPPRKSTQPSAAQRKILTDWMTDALHEAAEAARYADGRVVTRRLTRYEYANTMRDLLGINLDFARDLPRPGFPRRFSQQWGNPGNVAKSDPNISRCSTHGARCGDRHR